MSISSEDMDKIGCKFNMCIVKLWVQYLIYPLTNISQYKKTNFFKLFHRRRILMSFVASFIGVVLSSYFVISTVFIVTEWKDLLTYAHFR